MAQEKTTSLRLAEVTLAHFRTYGSRVVIPLTRPDGGAAPLVVWQGDNGAGKSSAVAALEFFFRATIACLAAGASGSSDAEVHARWDLITSVGHRDLLLRRRDRPPAPAGATEVQVRFADDELGVLRIVVDDEGDGARVKLTQSARGQNFFEPDRAVCEKLLLRIENPYGTGSRPLAALTARRRALWLPEEAPAGALAAGLSVQLFRLRTSLDPSERRRWRAFVEVLSRFEAFAGKDISIERLEAIVPQILVEDPGRVVSPLPELGAGEQQLVALAAALLLGRGAILAVEKPEAHLDARHQRTAQEIFEAYAAGGLVDQVILESNSPCFARGLVTRFARARGSTTTVERVEPQGNGALTARREAPARL